MVAAGLLERLLELFEIHVADPLEEHEREDVGLEVGLVDAAAEEVGRSGEVLLQLGQRELLRHRVVPSVVLLVREVP